jgi:opacity protein-like surface antigen
MAHSAQAQPRGYSPTYAFVYGDYAQLSGNGLKLDGGGGGIGWHFMRYVGIQGGGEYFHKGALDWSTANAELMLTYPATDKFSLYAGLGGGYVHAAATAGTAPISGNSTGWRAGLGMEYWFSKPFGLRAAYHRQNVGVVSDEMNVGLAFRF